MAFTSTDGPREPPAVAEAVLSFLDTAGLKLKSMTVRQAKSSHPRFSARALRKAFDDPSTREVWVWAPNVYDGMAVRCFLRCAEPVAEEFELRFVTIVSNQVPMEMTSALRRLADAFVDQYPVVHGSIGGYRSTQYASQECSFSGSTRVDDMDEETKQRLKTDSLDYQISKHLLRRLYPVTIIGPELWAKLPPLPQTEVPVKVEDLGNCKMLTCWHEMVEPHDPAFLAGTKELRRWIWPHTILNPADEPDSVDAKLGI